MDTSQSSIVYQPIVSLRASSGYSLEGHEILSRFNGRDTQATINSMERSGEIIQFEKDFIIKCLKLSLSMEGSISFNISNASINDRDFLLHVESIIKNNTYCNAKIEITETHKPNVEMLRDFIDICHAGNIKVGLDDFGSGFANFNMLNESKFDFVKIDGSLTRKFDLDLSSRSRIIDVVQLAHSKNISVTIEQIERINQIPIFESIGIQNGQGHLFGQPKQQPHTNHEIRTNMLRRHIGSKNNDLNKAM